MQPDHPFTEPWQATAFALTVRLHDEGHFIWPDWTAAFAKRRQAPSAAPDGSDYFDDWVATLEQLMVDAHITNPESIDALSDAWSRAAHDTPHGQAIVLPDGAVEHAIGRDGLD